MIPDDLLVRHLCGKRGHPDDIAEAIGVSRSQLRHAVRKLEDEGHPLTRTSTLTGVDYSYKLHARRCRHPGCSTVLSRYNAGHYCSVHQPEEELPQEWFLPFGGKK